MPGKNPSPLPHDSERFRMRLTNDRAEIPPDAPVTVDMRTTRELYEERVRARK